MLEDKDYVMRIVHEWIRTLIKLIFNKDIDKGDDVEIPLEVMEQFRKLKSMIDDGEINEAENICWTDSGKGTAPILRCLCFSMRNSAERQMNFWQRTTTPEKKLWTA